MFYVRNRGGNISSSNCVLYQCLGPDVINVATYFALGRRCQVTWCGETVRQTADMLPENVTCGYNETVASSSISISARPRLRASRPAPCHVSRTISSARVATWRRASLYTWLSSCRTTENTRGLVTRSRGNVTLHRRVSSHTSQFQGYERQLCTLYFVTILSVLTHFFNILSTNYGYNSGLSFTKCKGTPIYFKNSIFCKMRNIPAK